MLNTSSNMLDFRAVFNDVMTIAKGKLSQVTSQKATADHASLRTAILAALGSEPKNARELTETILISSAGLLNLRSSQIQPLLASLVDEKMVEVSIVGDRKLYAITKTGKKELKNLAQNLDTSESKTSLKQPKLFELEFLASASKLAPVMLDILQTASKDQQKVASTVLDETRRKLHSILAEK